MQLIDARDLWEPMPKSLGDKRRRLSLEHIEEVLRLYRGFEEGDRSKIRDNGFFMYRRITVERPLRLRYEVSEDAIERLRASKAFEALPKPPANAKDPAKAIECCELAQRTIVDGLRALNGSSSTDRPETEIRLRKVLRAVENPTAALRRSVWDAVSVRDPNAPVLTNSKGEPLPDPELRDYEKVPLSESIDEYLEHEILPFVEDAWVGEGKARIGTEIPLTRLFHRYEPPRPLREIDAEIRELEEQIQELTWEVTN